jgi:hypothetical protein
MIPHISALPLMKILLKVRTSDMVKNSQNCISEIFNYKQRRNKVHRNGNHGAYLAMKINACLYLKSFLHIWLTIVDYLGATRHIKHATIRHRKIGFFLPFQY